MVKQNAGPIPFDAPLPGQSLTMEPGVAKWEHPPQFTDLNKLAQHTFERFTDEKSLNVLHMANKQKVPIEALVRTVGMQMFDQGMANPDLLELWADIGAAQLARIANDAGYTDMPMRLNKISHKRGEMIDAMARMKVSEELNKVPETTTPKAPKSEGFVNLKDKA